MLGNSVIRFDKGMTRLLNRFFAISLLDHDHFVAPPRPANTLCVRFSSSDGLVGDAVGVQKRHRICSVQPPADIAATGGGRDVVGELREVLESVVGEPRG